MLQASGPVNWEIAAQVATHLATDGATEPPVDTATATQLEELARAAQTHVVAETGLAATFTTPVRTFGRRGWAELHLEALRPVLEALAVTLGGASGGGGGDPMLADYLLHAGERSHGLDELAGRYLNYKVTPIDDLIGKGKKQLCMDQVPTDKVAAYSGEDADVAFRLHALLEPQLAPCGLAGLYAELEIPLVEVLAELEFNGIRLDVELLGSLSVDM